MTKLTTRLNKLHRILLTIKWINREENFYLSMDQKRISQTQILQTDQVSLFKTLIKVIKVSIKKRMASIKEISRICLGKHKFKLRDMELQIVILVEQLKDQVQVITSNRHRQDLVVKHIKEHRRVFQIIQDTQESVQEIIQLLQVQYQALQLNNLPR